MEKGSANPAFRQIRTLYTLGTLGGLTDAQLLELFLSRGGDDAQDAFAALVHRHGPMVLGVCRRMLPCSHDAEDSFQATFLILVRRAASIARRRQLGNWLYGVAVRTAKEARRRAARQRARERRLMETSQIEPAPVEDRAELLSLLDEELKRLPRHYRAALVACELEGKARREAALQLGLPEGTLSAHLARGRKLLHKRLVRRGVSLGVGPFAGLPRQIALATVADGLASSTVRAALGYMTGGTLTGTVPATVAVLVRGGLKLMFLTRLTIFIATLTAIGMAAVTAGVAWSAISTGPDERPTAQARAFRSTEGPQTVDFALQRAAGPSGVVLLPDGKPAEGAEVALASTTHPGFVTLDSGRFHPNANFPKVTTGPDGRFAFPPRDDKFLLIAIGDAGYADASSDEFAKSGKLALQPWGQIEGGVRIGARSGSDQEVAFQLTRPEGKAGFHIFYSYITPTNDRGRFRFDRVVPGPGTVGRVVVTEHQGMIQHMSCWQEAIDVGSGKTVEVRIGGKGRPVIGRFVPDGQPEAPVDWTRNEPVVMGNASRIRGSQRVASTQFPPARFASKIDKDSRFRVEDVPAGQYTLEVRVGHPGFGLAVREIAKVTMTVTVPEIPGGRINEPLDLGTITAHLFETLKAGDLAPDFTVKLISGADKDKNAWWFKLSDHQGKVVLISFWDTRSRPPLAELPILQDIQQTFGGDQRFMLIGLSCDQNTESAARYIQQNGLNWTNGSARDIRDLYKVHNIPTTFLVGPDGGILAKNLGGPALKKAIRDALKDEKRFAMAGTLTRPPRFPVTRFEVANDKDKQDGNPSVAVLDDCDKDFEADRPHRDALWIFQKSGNQGDVRAVSVKEFNTCDSVGVSHCVAIDAPRRRIYLCELASRRVTALDVRGHKLWQVSKIEADALVVDPRTGNLWCTGGKDLVDGETVVLDTTGREVMSFPVRGIDIAFDPQSDGFWLVGYGITKLSREGKILFHKPHEGWACVSVATNPLDGSVWIVERKHPQVAGSVNRLWHLDANGAPVKTWDLGDKLILSVACDPKTGTAWVVNRRTELLCFTADGRELPPFPIKAVAVAVSPASGQVWATTETELIRLDDDGLPAFSLPLGGGDRSAQSWLAAF